MSKRGVNKVILVGNLTADPKSAAMPNGNAVSEFSIATSESWKDRNTGEQKEAVEYHNLKAYGKLAEIANEYLKKGSKVYIEGSLKTESWEKDGVKHYKTIIIFSELQMLDSKPRDQESQNYQSSQQFQAPIDNEEIPF